MVRTNKQNKLGLGNIKIYHFDYLSYVELKSIGSFLSFLACFVKCA